MKKKSIVAVGITILLVSASAISRADAQEIARNSNPHKPEPRFPAAEADTAISLQGVTVKANFAPENRTPLNLTTITPSEIRLHEAASNYLEMFQGVAGVYATPSTGTFGDATLNMRGFKQDNIAILLNGIPIQGLTSGSMYWSNWMGLSDATYSVQVQKGLGASMLSDCAMGGMVNIVTKTSGSQPHTEFGFSTTEYGTMKYTLGTSTGPLPKGWSLGLNLSYTKGDGYVECSSVETFSYMLSISKMLGGNNTLIFTALGSPEEHDQRNTELTKAEVDRYGRDHSKNWGYLYGREYSIGHNHYHKPYFTLQHIKDGGRLQMRNSLYLAIADGGGSSTYNNWKSGIPSIISHQTSDGHIDFDRVVEENMETGISRNVMIDYLSGHTQLGAIASADYELTDRWKASAGLQYQYYDTWSRMEILDLLGGSSFEDPATGETLGTGDCVGSRYGRTTHHASGYVQGTYTSDKVSSNLGVSIFHGNYRRQNDATGETSAWAGGFGASVKGGMLWHACRNSDIYFNAGYNSRLPYASAFLASSDLSVTNDITNETNLMAETGWRQKWDGGGLEISAYVASWRNRTLTVSAAKQANAAAEKYQIKGLNALHEGLELTAHQRIASWLNASAYAMAASWKWRNSGNAITYDTYSGETLREMTISCDGIHVGDAPQTQLGAQLDARLQGGFYIHAGWQFNDRMYADFEPSSRTGTEDHADSYRFPAYNLVDATIGWTGEISGGIRMNVFATGRNLLDETYIERGTDGKSHDIDTFTGYWGAARNLRFGVSLSF